MVRLMYRRILLPLLSFAALCLPSAAFGQPVRCNGMVQFRPCGQPLANGRSEEKPLLRPLRNESPRYDFSPSKYQKEVRGKQQPGSQENYAEVLSQKMSVLKGSLGQWKGEIRGNGNVHLKLLWYRDGILSSIRYMGSINLSNKSTRYAFQSSFPRGPGWSWKVAAYATELRQRDY